jgi:hypothetical protein
MRLLRLLAFVLLSFLAAPFVHAHGTNPQVPECAMPSGPTAPLWARNPVQYCQNIWPNFNQGEPWFGQKSGNTCQWAIHCTSTSPASSNEYGYWDRNEFNIPVNAVNPCVAGAISTANATVGWARSGEAGKDDHVGPVTFPTGTICDGQCQAEITDQGHRAWRSAVPAPTGLHRLSVDFAVRRTAVQCTPAANDPYSSTATPMACPGQVGEVNGKTVCVGTAAAPVPSPIGSSAARQTGALHESGGNPKAGPKPTSGEGSGDGNARTPTAGTGTAAGGPAGAVNVTGLPATGTGKVTAPATGEEQANCGAPGQPKCGIDETGTPSGQGALSQAEGLLGGLPGEATGKLNDAKQLQSPGWTWSFEFPSGCTPFVFPAFNNFVINVCEWQPQIHALMAMMWIMAAVFLCVRMVFTTISGK